MENKIDQLEVELRLIALGLHVTKCYKCGRKIFFATTKHRKSAPVTMALKNHFIDCPYAKDIRKEKDRPEIK